MRVFAPIWLRRGVLVLMTVLAALPSVGSAEDIARWRLTSLNGFLALRSRISDYNVDTVHESEPLFEQEFSVRTQSYVYHPNFLNMLVGGSLLFDQRTFTRDVEAADESRSVSTNTVGWNLNTNLSFLRNKPYPVTLFFDRSNPIVSSGLAGSFNQHNTSMGVKASVLEPLSPIMLEFEVTRILSEGESTDQILDDTTDRVSVTASHAFFSNSRTELTYNLDRRTSASGSLDRPIEPTTDVNHNALLISRWLLGSSQQFELTNTSNYNLRVDPGRVDTTISPTLIWHHTPKLDSFYSYNFNKTSQDVDADADTLGNAGSVSVRYSPTEDLFGDLGINFDIASEARGFERASFGGVGAVGYSRPVPFGKLSLGGGLQYNHINQDAPSANRTVIDELVVLSGTTPVPLANDFVIAGSVTITNSTRTQTFIQDLDYSLIVIGSQTQVQRLIVGSITDGQELLVDYDLSSGGTFAYSTVGTRLNTNLALAKYYNVFARFDDRRQSVESGEPTFSLNSVTTTEVGTDADVPVWRGIRVGGRATYLRRNEDITPLDRTSVRGFVQIPLPYLSTLRVSARRLVTNIENSEDDENITGFMVNLRSRPWYRGNVVANYDYEEDNGGRMPRSRAVGTLRAEWRVRRLLMTAGVQYSNETQGDFERDRIVAKVELRRDW